MQFLSFQELSFQINCLYTFYHEFAHIIQNSGKDYGWVNEHSAEKKYSLQKHSKEIDADTFSAIYIARHLFEYYLKDFPRYGTKFLELITTILGSTLFFYISSFGNSNLKLYFYENSHPHPFIRIMRIMFTIGKYYEDEQEIKFNKIEVVSKIIDEIFTIQRVYNKNNLLPFKEEIVNNYEDIFNYLQDISDYEKSNIVSAVDKYNSLVAEK